MNPTFLTTDRIYLRAIEPADLEVIYQMENDPAMWDISSFTVPYSRYLLKQYIEVCQADIFVDKQIRLMIIEKESHKVMGTIDITDFVPLHKRGEVGIAVLSEYRNKGIAKEALTLLRNYAFMFLQLHQLSAYIPVDNISSLSLFKSCGFEQVGYLKEWLHGKDGYKDVILMSCINKKD